MFVALIELCVFLWRNDAFWVLGICVNIGSRLSLTCCWNSRLHLRVGAANDLENDMQVFRPFQNGSSLGISIGKHFFVSNESERFITTSFEKITALYHTQEKCNLTMCVKYISCKKVKEWENAFLLICFQRFISSNPIGTVVA